MKMIALFSLLLFTNISLAASPGNYPIVKGEVRKVDANSNRISIKHEAIPNLNMPGMTMSFAVQDSILLTGLSVGDKINFTADEVDGDLTVLWLKKATSQVQNTTEVFCFGVAPTMPKTNVELEFRTNKFSTIRYEYAEGPYQGTAYVNSMGTMVLEKDGQHYTYKSIVGDTELKFKAQDNVIMDAQFSHFNSGMSATPVQCTF